MFRPLWSVVRDPWSMVCLVALLGASCQTSAPWAATDLDEPGWTVRQGQAVWKASHDAPEIAGDLLAAHHPDGRAFVQFVKTPFPVVTARVEADRWRIDFAPSARSVAERGQPPDRWLWLHLAVWLEHGAAPAPWSVMLDESGRWQVRHEASGESLEGYLSP